MSLMLTHFNPVPWLLGFKTIKIAVEQLYSPSAMRSGLKLPFAIHVSRTEMDTVRIRKVVWILVKHTSPKRRPSVLSRTENGMEGGLCMAARAFSNVQPTIWNKTKRKVWYYECTRLVTRGMKAAKKDAGRPTLTYLGRVNCGVQSVECAAAQQNGVVFPSEAEREMKDGVDPPKCIVHVQNGIWAGPTLIGWLTRRRRRLARKWSDVIIGPIGGGYPLEEPMGGHKRRSWVIGQA